MIRLVPLVLALVFTTACTAGPTPVRTGSPEPEVGETIAFLEAEEEAELLLGLREDLRVYDVAEVAEAIDASLAGQEPTEEALISAIEAYLADRKEGLIREVAADQSGAITAEDLSERIGGALEERLFPVILAMEKKRLGL